MIDWWIDSVQVTNYGTNLFTFRAEYNYKLYQKELQITNELMVCLTPSLFDQEFQHIDGEFQNLQESLPSYAPFTESTSYKNRNIDNIWGLKNE